LQVNQLIKKKLNKGSVWPRCRNVCIARFS